MRYRAQDANGDMTFGQGSANFLVNSPAAVAQAIKTVLNLFQGQWFLDQTVGLPMYTEIIGFTQKTRDIALRRAILNTQAVKSITAYSSTPDPVTRKWPVSVTVDSIYGSVTVSNP